MTSITIQSAGVISSKWMCSNAPELSASHNARLALEQRLQLVQKWLRRTSKRNKQSRSERAETIHQLRVAIRRANAALELFAEAVPQQKLKSLTRRLKNLRRTAGSARDLDVMIQRLKSEPFVTQFPSVLKYLLGKRRTAQPNMSVLRRGRSGFKRRTRKLISKVRWRGDRPEPTFRELACEALQHAASQFFLTVGEDTPAPEALHPVRIAGKRLRYLLELVAPAFDSSSINDAYRLVTELQDDLGHVNDYVVSSQSFAEWSSAPAGPTAELAALAESESKRAHEAATAFRQRWNVVRLAELEGLIRKELEIAERSGCA